jgi:hypothetical protein
MGGDEHSSRGWFVQGQEGSRRCQGVLRATKDMVPLFLGDRILDLHGHGGVKRRRRARTKGPALAPDWRARARGAH